MLCKSAAEVAEAAQQVRPNACAEHIAHETKPTTLLVGPMALMYTRQCMTMMAC